MGNNNSYYLVPGSDLNAIGDAIREKSGDSSAQYAVSTMANAIANIETKPSYSTKAITGYIWSTSTQNTKINIWYVGLNSDQELEFKTVETDIAASTEFNFAIDVIDNSTAILTSDVAINIDGWTSTGGIIKAQVEEIDEYTLALHIFDTPLDIGLDCSRSHGDTKKITANDTYFLEKNESQVIVAVPGGMPALGNPASESDILEGKQVCIDGEVVTGEMPMHTWRDIEGTPGSIYIPAGYYEEINDPVGNDFTWTESRGTALGGSKWRQTFTGILNGYLLSNGAQIDHASLLSRYKDATEITPSGQSATTIGASATVEEPLVITEPIKIKNDSTLVAANIKSGVTINGVTGTYQTPQNFEIANFYAQNIGSGYNAIIELGPRQLIAGDENDGETYSMLLYTYASLSQPFPVITQIEGSNAGVANYIFNQNSYITIGTYTRAYPLIVTYIPWMSSDHLIISYRTDIS